MNTAKIIKKAIKKTASLKEDTLEAAALENSKVVINNMYKIIGISWDIFCSEMNITSKGITPQDLAWSADGKRIEDRLKEIFKVYSINKDLGFLWNRISMIIDTELCNAINAGAASIMIKYPEKYTGVYVVEITEGSCEECTGYSGEVFDLDEVAYPPFHPSCMCSIDIIEEDIDMGEIIVENDDIEF